MSARRAALALAAVATLGAAGAAAAQSSRYPAEEEDVDAAREQQSDFWEDVIEPGRSRYDELVDRAAQLTTRRGDPTSAGTATALLDEATALLPAQAAAWAWLGLLREQAGDHLGCADAYGTAWGLDPRWHGTTRRPPPRPLALGLGTCRARTGDLGGAAEVLEREVARGEPRTESYYRLGEVYIAQGRLDDARHVLEVALDGSPADGFYVHAAWALAVAADRARDPEDVERAGQLAVARDPQLVRVGQPPAGFLDGDEREYYLGLGEALIGHPERALIHLRQYVAVHDGPWRARARERIEEAATFAAADRVVVEKTDTVDEAAVKKQMVKAEAGMRACMKATPRLLLSVRITLLAPPLVASAVAKQPAPARVREPQPPSPSQLDRERLKRARRVPGKPRPPVSPPPPPPRGGGSLGQKTPPAAGVRASIVLAGYDADAAASEAALGCVERLARKIKLPAPTTPGTWLSATMPVVWR